MPESAQHIELVKIVLSKAKEIVPNKYWPFIAVDDICSSNLPPQTSEGYRPDLLYNFDGLLVIGEAKTSKDVERPHSCNQYKSYLRKCKAFPGTSYLIMAVPWTEKIEIHNLLTRLKKQESCNSCNVIVIDNVKRG